MTAPDSQTSELPVWTPDEIPAFEPSDDSDAVRPAEGPTAPATLVDPIGVEPPPSEVASDHAPGPAVRAPEAGHLPIAAARPGRSRSVPVFLGLATFVFVAGVAFSIGRSTAPTTVSGANAGQNGGFGPGGAFPDASGFPGGGPRDGGGGAQTISGTVVSVDGATMTVKLANGSTVQIATTSSTTYHGQQVASQSDVAAGKTVTVQVSGGFDPGATASAATTRTATDVTIGQ